MSTKSGAKETFQQLLASLHRAASDAETDIGVDAPGQADSLEQGEGAGSTVADIEDIPAEQASEELGPGTQELGEDPSSGAAPTPVKSEPEGVITDVGTGDNVELIKTAEAMEAQAQVLLHQACSEIMAELCVRKYAEAVEEAATGLESDINVDPETAQAIAEALASGEISAEDLEAVKEQTDAVMEVAEATGADPGEVMQYAQQIDEIAGPQGLSAEEVADSALMQHEAAAEAAQMEWLKSDFANAKQALHKAQAENDEFGVMVATGKLTKISQLVGGHWAASDTMTTVKRAETGSEQAAPRSNGTSGEDQIASEMVGTAAPMSSVTRKAMAEAGIPTDEIDIAQQAMNELRHRGMPEDIIAQTIADELSGNCPVIPHNATAEELAEDPKVFAHVFVRTAVQEFRQSKAAR